MRLHKKTYPDRDQIQKETYAQRFLLKSQDETCATKLRTRNLKMETIFTCPQHFGLTSVFDQTYRDIIETICAKRLLLHGDNPLFSKIMSYHRSLDEKHVELPKLQKNGMISKEKCSLSALKTKRSCADLSRSGRVACTTSSCWKGVIRFANDDGKSSSHRLLRPKEDHIAVSSSRRSL